MNVKKSIWGGKCLGLRKLQAITFAKIQTIVFSLDWLQLSSPICSSKIHSQTLQLSHYNFKQGMVAKVKPDFLDLNIFHINLITHPRPSWGLKENNA